MTRILASPSRYIQGPGELSKIYQLISNYGDKFLALADEFVLELVSEKVESSFIGTGARIDFLKFNGECTNKEIARLLSLMENKDYCAVIGIGGGKTLDASKVISEKANIPVMIVPTIASTDAPCSALAVIYSEDGEFEGDFFLKKSPEMVIVDTEMIANAPSRLLVSGMGDAFATYYEARACRRADKNNMLTGKGTKSAFALAELCRDILLEDGLNAKISVDNKIVSKYLENVVEANIYLSGVGFESNGVALAHGIYNGFTTLKRKSKYYHGEGVAFGTIVQLVAEKASSEEIDKVFSFYASIGLPLTLRDLGMGDLSTEELHAAALATYNGKIASNMNFEISTQDIVSSIIMADALGKEYQQRYSSRPE